MNKLRCFINQGLLVAISMFAMVAANADVVGTWEGQVSDGSRPIPVVLTVDQESKPGQAAGKIQYGKPWDCSLNAEYSGTDNNTNSKIFALSVPMIGAMPGPHCKALIDGSIAATPGSSNELLNIVVSTRNNEVKDKTTLQRKQ